TYKSRGQEAHPSILTHQALPSQLAREDGARSQVVPALPGAAHVAREATAEFFLLLLCRRRRSAGRPRSRCSSPAPPGPSCPKLPVEEEFVLNPTSGYGSCSTPDKPPCGTSEDVKQRDVDPPPPAREGVGHRVVDPPRGGRGRRAPDEPEQCAQEHPKYPVPDSSSDKVCSSAVPPPAPGPCTRAAPDVQPPVTPAQPDRSGHKLPDHEESVVNPLPDPPSGHRLGPVIEEPAQCTLDNAKYPTPGSSSHKLPAHEELVIHPLPDPSGNRLSPVIKEPAQCTLDNPKCPTPDNGSSSPSEGASGDLLEDPLHQLPDPPRRP
ncbi:vegetative cell wall protein gp1-like, partial [Triticum dicoccoides]|uniref:vegetative cell wall protein gp1-like n=1 Tax=Triticum dicoccoides TaxID=85692 RepID=UPI001891B0D7